MVIKPGFPQIYKLTDNKTGKPYYSVDTRSKKWGMKKTKRFPTQGEALEHRKEILERIEKTGSQAKIPVETARLAERFSTLLNKLEPYGKMPEEAVEHYIKFLGDEVIRSVKPDISVLAQSWKEYKSKDTSLTNKTLIEAEQYRKFITLTWGFLKPDDVKKNQIDKVLKELKVANNTRKKYLMWIRQFFGWVKDEGHITVNPTDGLYFKSDEYNADFYSPEDTRKLMNYVMRIPGRVGQ